MSNDLTDDLKRELEAAGAAEILSPEYRRKKLIIYVVRTILSIILYYFLWEYKWVRLSLWAYVPLNLFGLGMIVFGPYFLKKKMEKVQTKIGNLEATLEEEE